MLNITLKTNEISDDFIEALYPVVEELKTTDQDIRIYISGEHPVVRSHTERIESIEYIDLSFEQFHAINNSQDLKKSIIIH